MTKNYHRIPITLSANSFKSFAAFDTMQRKKSWRYPVTAAIVFFISGTILFSFQDVNANAFIPGCIFIAAGAGIGMNYFSKFNSSILKQIEKMKLDPPRHVYTIELTDTEGVYYYHPKETSPAGTYSWKSIYGVWRTKNAIYLYVTQQQALLFPLSTKKLDQDEIWAFITKRLDDKRIHDVSKQSFLSYLK